MNRARRFPWLHIAREVASEARRSHFKRLGVLGTRYLMEGPVYPEKLKAASLEHRTPGPKERERINQIIMDELVNAQFTLRSLAFFQEVIQSMAEEGCDAVVLGCTEIPLLVAPESSSLPTLDSTRLLARERRRSSTRGRRGLWKSRRQAEEARNIFAMQPEIPTTSRQLHNLSPAAGCSIPEFALKASLFSVTRTTDELSIVCPTGRAPENAKCEGPWTCFKLEGPFPFSLTGVLASFLILWRNMVFRFLRLRPLTRTMYW